MGKSRLLLRMRVSASRDSNPRPSKCYARACHQTLLLSVFWVRTQISRAACYSCLLKIVSQLVQPGDFNVRAGRELAGMWNVWGWGAVQWRAYVTFLKHSGQYMYRTVVNICTASLTVNNSTFCPHSVFMCFVWISEQTAIISLYSIS